MPFRKFFFWLHLIAGLIAGLSIAIMCFTGTVLAFEKQIVAWAERDARLVSQPAPDAPRLSIEELTRRFRAAQPEVRPSGITVAADPCSAVVFSVGRDGAYYVNPYSGEVRQPTSTKVHDFMHVMEDWHRWLALSGDNRPVGKAVNGACNLAFFVLAVTGLYLWWPRSWSWRSVRAITLFNWRLAGKARDFNWHNSIGLWSAFVLIVLTLTAVPMSYRWGNTLIYRLVGEEPPVQQQGPPATTTTPLVVPTPPAGTKPRGHDELFAAVRQACPAWEQISLRLGGAGQRGGGGPQREGGTRPAENAPASAPRTNTERPAGEGRSGPQPVAFTVKEPGVWPRTATTTVSLNPFTGEILRREVFGDQSAGRQLRAWTRFLHTGEALGWGGQLAAGLASLGGCFLVYTGVALSYRRFFRRNQSRPAAGTAPTA